MTKNLNLHEYYSAQHLNGSEPTCILAKPHPHLFDDVGEAPLREAMVVPSVRRWWWSGGYVGEWWRRHDPWSG